ncbi:hypothetical protein DCCM_0138 [Desulfocucumis palustris]|uniref:Uncharacterized protein n=1 Tax=Desulfocucumis palustris TaxID=1898651 RepID=A0A2L2X7H7_9FIRM|nr:hypothetical protein DCCM_0138 [Desulfocucumis palustris]
MVIAFTDIKWHWIPNLLLLPMFFAMLAQIQAYQGISVIQSIIFVMPAI